MRGWGYRGSEIAKKKLSWWSGFLGEESRGLGLAITNCYPGSALSFGHRRTMANHNKKGTQFIQIYTNFIGEKEREDKLNKNIYLNICLRYFIILRGGGI